MRLLHFCPLMFHICFYCPLPNSPKHVSPLLSDIQMPLYLLYWLMDYSSTPPFLSRSPALCLSTIISQLSLCLSLSFTRASSHLLFSPPLLPAPSASPAILTFCMLFPSLRRLSFHSCRAFGRFSSPEPLAHRETYVHVLLFSASFDLYLPRGLLCCSFITAPSRTRTFINQHLGKSSTTALLLLTAEQLID